MLLKQIHSQACVVWAHLISVKGLTATVHWSCLFHMRWVAVDGNIICQLLLTEDRILKQSELLNDWLSQYILWRSYWFVLKSKTPGISEFRRFPWVTYTFSLPQPNMKNNILMKPTLNMGKKDFACTCSLSYKWPKLLIPMKKKKE